MPITLKPLVPEEAVGFFRQKGYAVTFDHRDMAAAEHQAAFTVAKAMQMDLLEEIWTQVDDALANGGTLAQFIDQLKPNLVKRGWWGVQQMTDPKTGEARDVQLGSPRRLKTILDTNLRTAHGEGQWQRVQESKDALPYVMYDHTPSKYERKEHAAWDGLVLPVDDPWVAAHWPIKAWGCKCRMIPVTARMAERQGKTVGTAPAEQTYTYTNKRTGETMDVPVGVDPEFNYPPGGRRQSLTDNLASRIERLPADLRPAAVQAVGREAFDAWAAKPAGAWPVGVVSEQLAKALGGRSNLVRLAPAAEGEAPPLAAADLAPLAQALERASVGADDLVRVVIEQHGQPVEFEIPKPDAGAPLVLRRAAKPAKRSRPR
ncbi:phage minor head protein [Zoogloea sp. 1C4]|uniref:phage head morphogenesis protein n=1 Tax=Zoogloea sp. 1C4 TaxID=2570190 RepID=UPI00129254AB|nr:phage minor head protein [Zoogloea sp. 1C4]